jgi:uncharacterized protein YcaQ
MSAAKPSEAIDAKRSDLAHARHYVLAQLALAGPMLASSAMKDAAHDLGMIQIDSIRVCGLRNHEIAWAARGDATTQDYYDLLYRERAFVETHYPLFAVRRDWVGWFQQDFAKGISRQDTLRELRPLMRQIKRQIRDQGPVSPADFDSERIPGGFNTVKASTKALEYLYYLGEVQIAGRTEHFHRLFDLTERVAPELLSAQRRPRRELEDFCVLSAAQVLKLATREELARRTALHLGSWRKGGLPVARKAVERVLAGGQIVPAEFLRAKDGQSHLMLAGTAQRTLPRFDETVRIVPPLDNLLFCRTRLHSLFGVSFKFEAYTPKRLRRFYFALPIVYRDRIIGMLDAKKDGAVWRINDLEFFGPAPQEPVRAALRRLAGRAGGQKIECARSLPSVWRRALDGDLDR